jgi:hypothetical protein
MNITTAHEWSPELPARHSIVSHRWASGLHWPSQWRAMSCVSSSHRVARYHVERMVADTGGEQPIYDDSSLQPPGWMRPRMRP